MALKLHRMRAGVIGTGFISAVHIEALKRLGVQVTAVCGSARGAQHTAERWGIPEVYGDYDYKALLRSPNVDVVHITSPNKAHVEQSLAALNAGKHVLCEKPLGVTTGETAKVVKATARKDSPVLAVNYICRFFPAVLQMRAMVARGDLGQIMHVHGRFFQDWLLKDTDYNWRVLASEGGKLRAVGDIGTHWMDTVSFILGARVESIFAHLETFHKMRSRPRSEVHTFTGDKEKPDSTVRFRVDTEDFGSVLMRFGKAGHKFVNGVHANALISQVAAGYKCSMTVGIFGTKKSVYWDFQYPDEILVGGRDEPNQVLQRATAGFDKDIIGYTDYPGGHPEGFADSHKMQYRAFYQHVANRGKAPALFASAADGHYEVQLCEAILRSSARGTWIKVKS
jgi:predicted dehydrogenase